MAARNTTMIYNKPWNKTTKNTADKKEATISSYESSFTYPADVPSLVHILKCCAIGSYRRDGFIPNKTAK